MMEETGFDMQQVERLHESCLEQVSVDTGSCGAQIGRRILQRVDGAADTVVDAGATAAMIIPVTIETNEQTISRRREAIRANREQIRVNQSSVRHLVGGERGVVPVPSGYRFEHLLFR